MLPPMRYRFLHARPSLASIDLEPSKGAPLPDDVRRQAEELFGEDLSDVRIFESREAMRMGVLAFTYGNQIHFAPGQYDPRSQRGQRLLGHELAHVLQQRSGLVRNTIGYGIQAVRDERLEAEADRMGALFASRSQSRSQLARRPSVLQCMDVDEQAIQDQAGHGNMTRVMINGRAYRRKPTTLVEAYVYARLYLLYTGDVSALYTCMPELARIIYKDVTYTANDDPTYEDFVNMVDELREEPGVHIGTIPCEIVILDVVEALGGKGYENIGVLDVKIGAHTFSNREAMLHAGTKKNPFNRLQMTINEWSAKTPGDGSYQVAQGGKLARQLKYGKSQAAVQLFVVGCDTERAIGTLEKVQAGVAEAELALIGSSILLVKGTKNGATKLFAYLIDPAHGVFEDEVQGRAGYENFMALYIKDYNDSIQKLIHDIQS